MRTPRRVVRERRLVAPANTPGSGNRTRLVRMCEHVMRMTRAVLVANSLPRSRKALNDTKEWAFVLKTRRHTIKRDRSQRRTSERHSVLTQCGTEQAFGKINVFAYANTFA